MFRSIIFVAVATFSFIFNIQAVELPLNEDKANVFNAKQWLSISSKTSEFDKKINSKASKKRSFIINYDLLAARLTHVDSVIISLPIPDGSFADFQLTYSPVMALELAEKHPLSRTFSGYQVNKPQNNGRFDISPHGFHAVFNNDGDTVYIDPSYRENNRQYHSYFRKDAQPLNIQALGNRLPPRQYHLNKSNKLGAISLLQKTTPVVTDITTYRIAIATTGEYSQYHGGTKESTLAALVTLVNRLNEVYGRELSIQFSLVVNNDDIIFTDAELDPFDNTDNDIDVISGVISNAIGKDNFDIGHVVGTGGGGLAGLGVVCSIFKAEGLTGSPTPTNDTFYIDYVAHEIGHQFGANHTFNGVSGACEDNRISNNAYEPGSGSTIMGYAGICGQQDLQSFSDEYFYIHSIDQIQENISQGTGNTCGARIAKTNQTPSVDAGIDYVIPARTPFELTGEATDPENNGLTYTWQQYDLGAETGSVTEDAADDGARPLFRVFNPESTPNRIFPKISDILNNQQTHGEVLPTTSREMNFRLVVRDTQGNLADDAMKVTVVENEEGFNVTEPAEGIQWNGFQQTVTWHPANTEQAPISCTKVDIFLSTDSGNNFSQTLADNVDNNGSYLVSLSKLNTDRARIKIQCANNIFFAINTGDYTINSEGPPVAPEFTGQIELQLNEDQSLVLQVDNFTFADALVVDNLQINDGDNYQVNGLIITPTANFNGQLNVTLTASNQELISDPFTALITVLPVNDEPIAVDDSITVEQDSSSNVIDVIANDSDIDLDTLTLASVTYTGTGNAVINENKVVYTPATGFSGNESLSYRVNDGSGGIATASLSITVEAKVVQEPEPTDPNGGSSTGSSSSSGGSMWFLIVLLSILSGVRLNFYSPNKFSGKIIHLKGIKL
ncbi:MAG: cadherin-like domain-containing protein [Alteromonadaceae bacterium]|nr:cadherin-like domain-containing protein [Alteromonadaceae bacterium]